jgi:CRP/FNR family cyclic AMP-dependent transcriptional regulator
VVSLDTLRDCELFSSLGDRELAKLAAIACENTYDAGTVICAERNPARQLFILRKGRVQLDIRLRPELQPGGDVTIAEVEPGRIFGWSSLVKQRSFTASATALEEVTLVAIEGDDLIGLLDEDMHLGFVVMKQLAEVIASRLHHTREKCETSIEAA